MEKLTEYQKSVLLGATREITVRGISETRQVFVNGEELHPEPSQAIRNHSPDGFAWGYSGSGCSQLALALLLHELNDKELAQRFYQQFKSHFVSALPFGKDFEHKLVLSTYFETVIKVDDL